MDKEINNFQVLIIGAGCAGIGAAINLKKQNLPYIILEARHRIGGRTLTNKIDGVNVDLGASWIHSYGKKNSFNPYVKKLQVKQTCRVKRQRGRIFIDGQKGQQFPEDILEIGYMNSTYISDISCKRAAKSKQDMSIYEGAKQFIQGTISKFSPEEKRCTQIIVNMKQHYEGSSIKEQSVQYSQYRIDEGGDFSPQGGYGSFIKEIAESQKIKVELNKVVVQVIYDEDSAKVICKDGSIFYGKKIISSLPLGVLKAKKVKFTPELPQAYESSIKKLGFGLMNKIVASFQKCYWKSAYWFSVGCDQRGRFSHIYNISTKQKHLLCCFITDDFARKMQNLANEEILEQFVSLLKKIFHQQDIKIRDYAITKWGKQEFSLGSYSSFHVGSSPDDSYFLRKPIKNIIWMVGQHCYAEHIGTAHGAFKTGQMAAQQVLKSLKWVNPIYKQPMRIQEPMRGKKINKSQQ